MGKKIQKQQENPQEQQQQSVPPKIKAIEKYLPHHKYVIKRSKIQNNKKQQCISFIKLDKHQINSAVACLKQFVAKSANVKDLFHGTNEAFIYLEVDLSEVPENYSIRPIQIPLPTPIYSEKYNSRCAIFTSDPESDFTSKIDGLNLPMVSEAIGYERAKKHFRDNKEKLKLMSANDAFFCDWKIYNLLRKPLGKLFYEKKRYPFPIDCDQIPEYLADKHKSYEEYLNSLMSFSYTMLGNGPVYTLKVGRFDMSNSDLVKNIMRGAYRFLPYVLENIDVSKVRQISIKGFNSPSLPIYNFLSKDEVTLYQKHKKLTIEKSQPKEPAVEAKELAVESKKPVVEAKKAAVEAKKPAEKAKKAEKTK